jgi:hypothetical protein
MAKRGRPRQNLTGEKSAIFSTRLPPSLKGALQREAVKNRQSLSREIELRLASSLADGALARDKSREELAASVGGLQNFGLVLLFGELLNSLEMASNPLSADRSKWIGDADLRQEVKKGLAHILSVLGGEADFPEQRDNSIGCMIARGILNGVGSASDEPAHDRVGKNGVEERYSVQMRRAVSIRRLLGDLAARLKD